MDHFATYLKGLGLTATGVLIVTPDTLLIRLIGLPPFDLLVWRGSLQFLGICVLIVCFYGRNSARLFHGIGGLGLVAAAAFALSSHSFVFALSYTSVANTLVLLSASPFFSALLSAIFLKEHIPWRTRLAILFGLGGVAIIVVDGLGGLSLIGDLAALVTALALAINFVILRHRKDISMLPAMAISGLIIAALAWPFAGPETLDSNQLTYVLVMGLAVVPFSFSLLTIGPRFIPAAEVSLLLLLETVLGPLWVWLVLSEVPPFLTFIGGGLVVMTLLVQSIAGLRANHRESRLRPALAPMTAVGPAS